MFVPGWEIWSWSVRISTEAAIVHHVDKAASDMRSENRVATTCDAVVVFGPAIWSSSVRIRHQSSWRELIFLQIFQKLMIQALITYFKGGILGPPNIVILRIMAGIGMIWVVGENQGQVLSHRWAAAKLVTALCWQYSRSAIVAVSNNAAALQLQIFPWQWSRSSGTLLSLGPFLWVYKIFNWGKEKTFDFFSSYLLVSWTMEAKSNWNIEFWNFKLTNYCVTYHQLLKNDISWLNCM